MRGHLPLRTALSYRPFSHHRVQHALSPPPLQPPVLVGAQHKCLVARGPCSIGCRAGRSGDIAQSGGHGRGNEGIAPLFTRRAQGRSSVSIRAGSAVDQARTRGKKGRFHWATATACLFSDRRPLCLSANACRFGHRFGELVSDAPEDCAWRHPQFKSKKNLKSTCFDLGCSRVKRRIV